MVLSVASLSQASEALEPNQLQSCSARRTVRSQNSRQLHQTGETKHRQSIQPIFLGVRDELLCRAKPGKCGNKSKRKKMSSIQPGFVLTSQNASAKAFKYRCLSKPQRSLALVPKSEVPWTDGATCIGTLSDVHSLAHSRLRIPNLFHYA